MSLFARNLFQVAIALSILSGFAFAAPIRPARKVESPPRDIRIDPLAEKILRTAFQNTKWEGAVEKATYKLLAIEESSGYKRAIAATEVSLGPNGELLAKVMVIAQWTGDEDQMGTFISEPLGAGPPAKLIFDRPIRVLEDLGAAKLREIKWGGVSMNFRGAGKK